jgi:DNA-binding YbaB/EbfC family protein
MADFNQLLQLTGSSGGGMVRASANGRGEIQSIQVDPSVVSDGDVEMLEDLVLAAVSEAQRKAQELYKNELGKVTGGLPLPFQLPL